MLLRIVSILLPVLSIVLIGYVYARRHAPDMVTVNRINMDLFVPALVFVALASKDVQLSQYGWLALGAAGVVLGSGLLAWPLSLASPAGEIAPRAGHGGSSATATARNAESSRPKTKSPHQEGRFGRKPAPPAASPYCRNY